MRSKIAFLVILGFSALALAQDINDEDIANVFGGNTNTNTNPDTNTGVNPNSNVDNAGVDSVIDSGTGVIYRCGEDPKLKAKFVCVPYFQCSKSKLVIRDGISDGADLIDIRAGEDSECEHYLDVCCQDQEPNKPLPPPNPEPTLPPTTALPPTAKPTRPNPNTKPTKPTPRPPRPPTPPDTKPVTPPRPVGTFKCGQRNPQGIDFKITGNNHNEAEYGEFPWMIGVLIANANGDLQYACGGSLIHPQVVLTGAHCVHKVAPTSLRVRAGEWDTQTIKERLPHQERSVQSVSIHKDYITKVLFNDIALLFLDVPFDPAENIGTVCLPRSHHIFTSRNCFASGWGKSKFGQAAEYQVILKKIELPVVDKNDCQTALRSTRLGPSFTLHRTFMCAGGEAGKDTCTGDGGSPLVCPDPQNPQRYQQAGIVAWGIGCGETGIPGVYVDVAELREWVDQQMVLYGFGTQTYTD